MCSYICVSVYVILTRPKNGNWRNIRYPAPEICHFVTLQNPVMNLENNFPRFISIWELHLSLTQCSPSLFLSLFYVSSSSSPSSILSTSIFSLFKGRSLFPALISSTCNLGRWAKELSSTESTDSRLNLHSKKIKIKYKKCLFPMERWLKNQITPVRRVKHLRDPYRGTHLLCMHATLYCNIDALSHSCFTLFTLKHGCHEFKDTNPLVLPL